MTVLETVTIPPRDRYDLAERFFGIDHESVGLPEPTSYAVGDVIPFWVENITTDEVFRIMAELVYAGQHVYMWIEQGLDYDYERIVAAAERFDQQIYPTNRSYFGSEPSPGIDSDAHLHVLHSAVVGSGVAGYFYSPSEYPATIVPYSNEKEIFYINMLNTPPGSSQYNSVLAHEFQHMIHWNVDRNEESWLNEGMSELAPFLNGLGPSWFIHHFMQEPDIQLTDWPEGPGGRGAHYGAAFLFSVYFLDRFGQDAVQVLVSNPLNGLTSMDDTLARIDAGVTADDVFSDWVITNILNDPNIQPGYYSYPSLPKLEPPYIAEELSSFPEISELRSVHQYGTDYIRLRGPVRLLIRFEGEEQARIIPTSTLNTDGNPATDDTFVWWSNRGDDSDMMLTRRFDLSDVEVAVLEYDVWYWLEELWDYGYVALSTDGGQAWVPLTTRHTSAEDPHGNAYGPGYTGRSADLSGSNTEGWLHETVDLSAYAGREIMLRFEMVTDDAVNQPGMAIDNICIAAIGFCDDVEDGPGDWETRGFVRHDNLLAQHYSVQVILTAADGMVTVLPFPLDGANRGEIEITIEDWRYPAILVVSGMTRYTTIPAIYRYEIIPLEN